jgi:hypothetical protein
VVVNRCWLCEMEGESVDHLLLHCATASALWNAFFFVRFGLCWVMPRSVKELIACWWLGGRLYEECNCVENGPTLYFVVYLEGKKQ